MKNCLMKRKMKIQNNRIVFRATSFLLYFDRLRSEDVVCVFLFSHIKCDFDVCMNSDVCVQFGCE